jgi:putative Mg2+ transporter-C (MgtC) family protein
MAGTNQKGRAMLWTDVALRLGAAALLGAAIGLDREILHKAAGVRTIGLVSLGAALAVLSAGTLAGSGPDAASRVIQGTLAGIGFLGGGVILHHRGAIEGLTTAAAIWTAAALGAACGLAAWPVVAVGSVLIFVLLILARFAEMHFSRPRN